MTLGTALRKTLALLVAIAAAGAFIACSATSPSERPPVSQRLPSGVKAPLSSPSNHGSSTVGEAFPSDPSFPPLDYTRDLSPHLDLARFAPLLALPELAKANAECAEERFGRCADAIESWLNRHPPSILEEPRYYLMLGNLRLRDNDATRARVAFKRSSSIAWPLTDFALLGLARANLALGRLLDAEAPLLRITSGSTYPAAQGLLAQLSCPRGDTKGCLRQLEAYTSKGLRPPGWARAGFAQLEQLVAQLTRSGQPPRADDKQLALGFVRKLTTRAPNTAGRMNAAGLVQRLLAALPETLRLRFRERTAEEQLERLRALAAAGLRADTESAAKRLLRKLGDKNFGPIACEARYLWGRTLSSRSQRARGIQTLLPVIEHCTDPDKRAWSLYLIGKYSFRLDEYADADRFFAKLELEAPNHRLADDARLYRARAQLEMGVEARFSQLLGSMEDDYPKGDMVRDGVFQLALHSMKRGDWSGAEVSLRKLANQDITADLKRGPEWAGRERYFHARSLIQTGEEERGLRAYEALLHELPLSYYMLHAYSRLREHNPRRAIAAIERELELGRKSAFEIHARPEFEHMGFVRFLELMRQGELAAAKREVKLLRFGGNGSSNPLLWGVSELWSQAGSPQYSHAIPRWQLHDWQQRWPAGSWTRAWRLAYPRPYMDTVLREAKGQNIEPQLVYAVMREESAFNPTVVSGANAYGLMQLIPSTAKSVGKADGLPYDKQALTSAKPNIALGARVLSDFQAHFPHDPLLAIPGYNAGPSRPKRWRREFAGADFDLWVELIPFRETRRYTKRVLGSRAAYAYLYFREENVDPLVLPIRLHMASK